MKRGRCDEESQNSEFKDWVGLFHIESILAALNPYLSTRTLIRLSCVNKRMNTTWINNERRLGVLNMRNRIFVIRGRHYKKNPLIFIKKASLKACSPPGKWSFKCWECDRTESVTYELMDQRVCKLATCYSCAKKYFEKNYILYSRIFWVLWNYFPHFPKPTHQGTRWMGGDLERAILEEATRHLITIKTGFYNVGKDYIHKSHFGRIIYWLRKAYPAPPAKDGSIATPLY